MMAELVVLTGASGAGKTTIAAHFAERHEQIANTFHFDSLGVPSPEEMLRDFGSGEAWQRDATFRWLERLEPRLKAGHRILLEGQVRRSFVMDACMAFGIDRNSLILVDCDDASRLRRLREVRNQPELANDEMLAWARLLRLEATSNRDEIIDTSFTSIEAAVERVRLAFLDTNEN